MGKKLLILGATGNQISLVKKAKELGIYTITMDWDLNNPAHKYSDESVNISTIDKESVLWYVKSNNIDGIITCATDLALNTVAYVCDNLRMNGPVYDAVSKTSLKDNFRIFQEQNSFFHPEYYIFNNSKSACEKAESLKGKYIVKPVDSSGSKGITTLDLPEMSTEIGILIYNAFKYSNSGKIIIEQYIEGQDFSIEGFVKNSKLDFFVMTDKLMTSLPFRIPIGHTIPAENCIRYQKKAKDVIKRYLKKLKIDTSPFDIDIKIAPDGTIYVLEMALRIGGNAIPDVTFFSTGYDLYKATISYALGLENHEQVGRDILTSGRLIISKINGVIDNINDKDTLLNKHRKYLKDIVYDYEVGEKVSAFMDGSDRVGHYIVCMLTREEIDEKCLLIEESINLKVV